MKSQLKLLNKYQILNFIKILLSGIKSLIKYLFKLVVRMLIINFLICIAVTFCNKKWDIIINLFLDNIFSIWDHLPGWENLKSLFLHNNTNNKFKTEVLYDSRAELKRGIAGDELYMFVYQEILLCLVFGRLGYLLVEWLLR
jgi:hypothetical protein